MFYDNEDLQEKEIKDKDIIKLKKKNINKSKNKNLNNDNSHFIKNILKEFKIDDKVKNENIFDKCLSSNVKELAKTIEDYRKEVISKFKKYKNNKKKIDILIQQKELLNIKIIYFAGNKPLRILGPPFLKKNKSYFS